MKIGQWIISSLLLCLSAAPVTAQETRGNISGTVSDASGVIPGATIKVSNVDTGLTQQLTTNASGYFEAPLLDTNTVSSGLRFEQRLVQDLPMLSNMPVLLAGRCRASTPTVRCRLRRRGSSAGRRARPA